MKSVNQSPLIYILAILGFLVLFAVAGNIAWGKISELNTELTQIKTESSRLREKMELLEKIDTSFLKYSENVAIALPPENPTLYVVSQIKKHANDRLLKLTNLRLTDEGTPIDEVLTGSNIEFDLEGNYTELLSFLHALRKSTPLVFIEKYQIDQIADIYRAHTVVVIYWSAFPEKLPQFSEPVTTLTKDEEDVLTSLSTYSSPVFTDLPEASPASQRVNPFGI